MAKLPKKLLVANRAEIACRVFRTCRKLGIRSVAIVAADDAECSRHHLEADEVVEVPSYLDMKSILDAAKSSGAEAIHPGYGFLAENPDFSDACADAGITFIGPSGETIRSIGDKSQARSAAKRANVPITEGLGPFSDASGVINAIKELGLPVMLKAAAGGGGKGMKLIHTIDRIEETVDSSRRETKAAFGDDRLIVEKYVYPARHIEVQIMGDGERAIAIGERECSLQRRHQKIIEESPAPTVSDQLRQQLFDSAKRIAESAQYRNAGTCEFLVTDDAQYYFLEVNARLQVEHPVTEMCTGLDLVEMQIRTAYGEPLPAQADIERKGVALEARLCAEDPYNGFIPSAGELLKKVFAGSARIDEGIGNKVSPNYDSLIAKIIVHSSIDREHAREQLLHALRNSAVFGILTNQSFLIQLLQSEFFIDAQTFTTTVDQMTIAPPEVSDNHKVAAACLLRGPVFSHPVWTSSPGWRLR